MDNYEPLYKVYRRPGVTHLPVVRDRRTGEICILRTTPYVPLTLETEPAPTRVAAWIQHMHYHGKVTALRQSLLRAGAEGRTFDLPTDMCMWDNGLVMAHPFHGAFLPLEGLTCTAADFGLLSPPLGARRVRRLDDPEALFPTPEETSGVDVAIPGGDDPVERALTAAATLAQGMLRLVDLFRTTSPPEPPPVTEMLPFPIPRMVMGTLPPTADPDTYACSPTDTYNAPRLLAHQNVPCNVWFLYRMLRGILVATQNLHALGWVHLDLKPGNFLLTEMSGMKAAPLGVAARFHELASAEKEHDRYTLIREAMDAHAATATDVILTDFEFAMEVKGYFDDPEGAMRVPGVCGTTGYIAPELLNHQVQQSAQGAKYLPYHLDLYSVGKTIADLAQTALYTNAMLANRSASLAQKEKKRRKQKAKNATGRATGAAIAADAVASVTVEPGRATAPPTRSMRTPLVNKEAAEGPVEKSPAVLKPRGGLGSLLGLAAGYSTRLGGCGGGEALRAAADEYESDTGSEAGSGGGEGGEAGGEEDGEGPPTSPVPEPPPAPPPAPPPPTRPAEGRVWGSQFDGKHFAAFARFCVQLGESMATRAPEHRKPLYDVIAALDAMVAHPNPSQPKLLPYSSHTGRERYTRYSMSTSPMQMRTNMHPMVGTFARSAIPRPVLHSHLLHRNDVVQAIDLAYLLHAHSLAVATEGEGATPPVGEFLHYVLTTRIQARFCENPTHRHSTIPRTPAYQMEVLLPCAKALVLYANAPPIRYGTIQRMKVWETFRAECDSIRENELAVLKAKVRKMEDLAGVTPDAVPAEAP